GMMRDFTARDGSWTHLNGTNPTRLSQSDVARPPPPYILMMRGHGPRFGFDDEVGRPQFLGGLPFVGVWPFSRTRHVFDITKRRAGVDPSNDRVDAGAPLGDIKDMP